MNNRLDLEPFSGKPPDLLPFRLHNWVADNENCMYRAIEAKGVEVVDSAGELRRTKKGPLRPFADDCDNRPPGAC